MSLVKYEKQLRTGIHCDEAHEEPEVRGDGLTDDEALLRPKAVSGRQNVLIVAPQPFYQDRGTPIAIKYVLTALTELGYKVDLLTYPLGDTLPIEGVRYIRLSNPLGFTHVPVGFSWKKVFLDLLLACRLPLVLRGQSYTYIHAVEEAAYLAALYRPWHKTRILYDMASSIPEQLQISPVFRSLKLVALFNWMEKWLLKRVDLVVASAGLGGIVRRLSPSTRLHEWCFPSSAPSATAEDVAALRDELGLAQDDKVIVYTGTFEAYQGVEDIVAAMPTVLAQSPDAKFVLIGATKQKDIDSLKAKVDPSIADKVRILPRRSKADVQAFLALADILLSPRKAGRNIPLKIFDYLAAGKPIVASDIEAHRSVLDDSLAVLVAPDADGMAEGINSLLGTPQQMEAFRRATRSYAESKLSWDSFRSFIQSLGR
jgi:glycosyltransferase involved in cell wall biosynthesis